ncbi:MAG TPA: hypothetical protein VJY37_05500 [Anaerovoracaceae bacterium]|nr:hypothetical protein [Anaerovoracaceae bacterium]
MNNKLSLGIDTSNYKTSVAVVDSDGNIIKNYQQFLEVKKGERGLRQSTALFQHITNLPGIMDKVLADEQIRRRIECVSVSDKPRPCEGSYMPVFNSGVSTARIMASTLGVPLYTFSHQEGHIEAIRYYSKMKDKTKLICFHFSGGTTEALLVDNKNIEIIGGTKDISYGQVLDRIGVALGMEFPCGQEMDIMACKSSIPANAKLFTPVKVKDCYVNLSGVETQGQRGVGTVLSEELIISLFNVLAKSIVTMVEQIYEKYQISDFLFAGGVSSSEYFRKYIKNALGASLGDKCSLEFGKPELSTDNAVGVALLGGKNIWL